MCVEKRVRVGPLLYIWAEQDTKTEVGGYCRYRLTFGARVGIFFFWSCERLQVHLKANAFLLNLFSAVRGRALVLGGARKV